MGEEKIRWRCGCKDADHCESPAKACQKVQRLEDEVERLREGLERLSRVGGEFSYLMAGPHWEELCGALSQARKALAGQ